MTVIETCDCWPSRDSKRPLAPSRVTRFEPTFAARSIVTISSWSRRSCRSRRHHQARRARARPSQRSVNDGVIRMTGPQNAMDEERLASYLRTKVDGAPDLVVEKLHRNIGGMSRETWFADATWTGLKGQAHADLHDPGRPSGGVGDSDSARIRIQGVSGPSRQRRAGGACVVVRAVDPVARSAVLRARDPRGQLGAEGPVPQGAGGDASLDRPPVRASACPDPRARLARQPDFPNSCRCRPRRRRRTTRTRPLATSTTSSTASKRDRSRPSSTRG